MSTIEIDGLYKQFGTLTAVDGIDLSVDSGEVFGFLGPNGAGKSTTINVMLDFLKPTHGRVRVFGMDPSEEEVAVRRRTGTLLEGYGVYPRLTGREHLAHARDVKGVDDELPPLIDRVGLVEAADRPAGDYSKGMKQRLAIAMAVIGDPELLILDEPTTGLDPNGARMVRRLVRDRAAEGTTVFFSSHILEQVEAVADRVGIVVDGALVAEGDLESLRAAHGLGSRLEITTSDVPSGLVDDLEAIDGVRGVTATEAGLELTGRDGPAKLEALSIVDGYGVLIDFDIRRSSLDDVFSIITGEQG